MQTIKTIKFSIFYIYFNNNLNHGKNMREVNLKVYKFAELDEDVQEELKEGTLDILVAEKKDEIDEKIKQYLTNELKKFRIEGLHIKQCQIEKEDSSEESILTLEGTIMDGIRQWESDEEFSEFVPLIVSAHISGDEDNEYELNLKYIDENVESEDGEDIQEFILEKISDIIVHLIEYGREFKADLESNLDEELQVKLEAYEYFKNGTVYDEEEH